MTTLPQQFLILSHEGIYRATINLDSVHSIDALLSRFTADKLVVLGHCAEHSHGIVHEVAWGGHNAWGGSNNRMAVLELTKGSMVLTTLYHEVKGDEISWVSPSFGLTTGSFPLRCAFEFKVWADAGLRLFLGLNPYARTLQFWVYFGGQIYRPPFGNIFDGTCQLCLGKNDPLTQNIFRTKQPDTTSLSYALQLLSDSTWNSDTFHSEDMKPLAHLVRFDSSLQELPMLPPRNPELIKKCAVAANKDLVAITQGILGLTPFTST
jgi:hypothetical protein